MGTCRFKFVALITRVFPKQLERNMSDIKVTVSNFLSAKSVVRFEDGALIYGSKTSPNDFEKLECSEIKMLTYDKPKSHSDAHRRNGLLSAVVNIFSASVAMKRGKQIEFDAHFNDGKILSGITSMEKHFEIQNAWLDSKPDVKS
jgi:hypothetical protein